MFVATRDGDLQVYVDAARAGGDLEAADVVDGEYLAAYRVDGAVLAMFHRGRRVDLLLTGEVDEAALRTLVEDYGRRVPSAPRGADPLDVAEAWLTAEWRMRWPRRPAWLDRLLHGSRQPSREELAAPPDDLGPGLVRPQRLRELVDEVLAPLPSGAVAVVEGTSLGMATLHLRPRAAGAVDVLLDHGLTQVDVLVADCPPIEITAPYNINYGPPELGWDEDLRGVLRAVVSGRAMVGETGAGRVVAIDIPGGRLGASGPAGLRTRHPAAWTWRPGAPRRPHLLGSRRRVVGRVRSCAPVTRSAHRTHVEDYRRAHRGSCPLRPPASAV